MLKTHFYFTRYSIFRPEVFTKKEKQALSNYPIFRPAVFTKKKHHALSNYPTFRPASFNRKKCTLKLPIILVRGLYQEKMHSQITQHFDQMFYQEDKQHSQTAHYFGQRYLSQKKHALSNLRVHVFLGKGLWRKYRVKSKIKMCEKLNKQVDSLYLSTYLPMESWT